MEQVEMNNMYINIDVNNGSEKCTEKKLWLLVRLPLYGFMACKGNTYGAHSDVSSKINIQEENNFFFLISKLMLYKIMRVTLSERR